VPTPSAQLGRPSSETFPLPWSHYVLLLSMNFYLNYALEGLQNSVLAREYRLVLPDEKRLAEEIEATGKRWEGRSRISHFC